MQTYKQPFIKSFGNQRSGNAAAPGWIYALPFVAIAAFTAVSIIGHTNAQPPPTKYEDRNGDSIADRIEYKKGTRSMPGLRGPIVSTKFREMVSYGFQEPNGDIVYLTKEEFDDRKR